MSALMKVTQPPFNRVKRNDYIRLLLPHEEQLKRIYEQSPNSLRGVLAKSEYDFDELVKRLQALKVRASKTQPQTDNLGA